MSVEGRDCRIYVMTRPHVYDFLKAVSELYEVVIFTASMSKVYGQSTASTLIRFWTNSTAEAKSQDVSTANTALFITEAMSKTSLASIVTSKTSSSST